MTRFICTMAVLFGIMAQPMSVSDTIWLTAGADRWKTWSGPFYEDVTATLWIMPDGTWAAEQTGNDPIFFGEGTWAGDGKHLDLAFDSAGYGELIGWDLTGELRELGELRAWAVAEIFWSRVRARISTPRGKSPKIKLAIAWKSLVEFHGTAKFGFGPWRLQRVTRTRGELWYTE